MLLLIFHTDLELYSKSVQKYEKYLIYREKRALNTFYKNRPVEQISVEEGPANAFGA